MPTPRFPILVAASASEWSNIHSLALAATHQPSRSKLRGIGPNENEPRHIHVDRDKATAKFWLDPMQLEHSRRFSRVELARIQKLVERHQVEFRRKWNDYFGTK